MEWSNYANASSTAISAKKIAAELKLAREELAKMHAIPANKLVSLQREKADLEMAAIRQQAYDAKLNAEVRAQQLKLRNDIYQQKKADEHKKNMENPIYAEAYGYAIKKLENDQTKSIGHDEAAKIAKELTDNAEKFAKKEAEKAAKEALERSREKRSKRLNFSPGDGKLRSALDTALLKIDADLDSNPNKS